MIKSPRKQGGLISLKSILNAMFLHRVWVHFKLIYHAVLFTSVAAGSKAIANLISENKEHLIST